MSFQSSEVLARLKPFGISFEKSLGDLIKGIRLHLKVSPDSLSTFLDAAIQECKNELSTTDMETKAMAILKLTYLEMYGFDMSWCNFQILEVMSSSKFQQKRIGYLAAIQSFKNEQDLLILATNQFKKDLNSHNHFEIGLALSGIATIVTPSLAKDINDDVLMKLTHSKPYIRKKAVLAMHKIFLQYPDSLRSNFTRILDKLDDGDLSVVSAAINVICEISKKSPQVFVNYLPKFFVILEETKNNWLSIRILKLFQLLLKVEPRMKKKILPTIVELMCSTQALSLVYECINCIVSSGMIPLNSSKDRDTAKLCIEHIMKFFETRDSNLKFVGLVALINIIKAFPVLIQSVNGVSSVIMDCLTDKDLIIKSRALEVCHYLVTEDNLVDIVKVLLLQLVPKVAVNGPAIPEHFKLDVTLKIVAIVSRENYENVPNFKWYVAVLKDIVKLTLLPLPNVNAPAISKETSRILSSALGSEFKNLATKIPSIRGIILDQVVFECVQDADVISNCPMLLKDLYWIMGEYIGQLGGGEDQDEDEDVHTRNAHASASGYGRKIQLYTCLVNAQINAQLFAVSLKLVALDQPEVVCVAIQALIKVFSDIVSDCFALYARDGCISHDKFNLLALYLRKLIRMLGYWETHAHYEVQERALSWLEFLKLCLEAMCGDDLREVERLHSEEVAYFGREAEKKTTVAESDTDTDGDTDSDGEDDESGSESSSDGSVSLDEAPPAHNNSLAPFEANPFVEDDKLPMLLTHVLPSFFKAYLLNPISWDSQANIAVPAGLDLDTPINPPMFTELSNDESDLELLVTSEDELDGGAALVNLSSEEDEFRKKERLEKQKYDPFYITGKGKKSRPTRSAILVETSPPPSSDILSIESNMAIQPMKKAKAKSKMKKEKVVILSEEKIAGTGAAVGGDTYQLLSSETKNPKKKSNFKIDSSNLDNFDLNAAVSPGEDGTDAYEYSIDLEELRSKLATTTVAKKKLKSKSGDSKRKKEKKPKVLEGNSEPSAVAAVLDTVSKESRSNSPESDVIAVKKATKKKKKAIIAE